MAKTTIITLTTERALSDLGQRFGRPANEGRAECQALAGLLEAVGAGMLTGKIDVQKDGTTAVRASAFWRLVNATGTVTMTVNGVQVYNATANADDAVTAAAAAAAVNASNDAKIAGIVRATTRAANADGNAYVDLEALQVGKIGNLMTIAGTGTGVTVSGSGVFTGGAGGDVVGTAYTGMGLA